jgi:hypothetical protein
MPDQPTATAKRSPALSPDLAPIATLMAVVALTYVFFAAWLLVNVL